MLFDLSIIFLSILTLACDLSCQSASDLIVEDNDKLKEQDRYNEVLDELEDEDDGSGLSVKEKIWNFLIT